MKKVVALLLALTLCFSFAACKSSEEKKTDSLLLEDIPAADKSELPVTEDPDAEIFTSYPGRDIKDSPYMDFVSEAPDTCFEYHSYDEGFFDESPYFIEGTVMEVYETKDDLDAKLSGLFPSRELFDKEVPDFKSFLINTVSGPVVVIDLFPVASDQVTKAMGDDILSLKKNKIYYDGLKNYTDFPAVGEKTRIYCRYMCFSEDAQIPVFTYGISKLVNDKCYGVFDYAKYRTDETKHFKYRNYVEVDVPVWWSDKYEEADAWTLIFNNGACVFDYYDDPNEGAFEDTVLEFFGDIENLELGPESGIAIVSTGYRTLKCGVTAYEVVIHLTTEVGYEGYERDLIFPHKHKLIYISYADYNAENRELYDEDYEKMLDSLTLCGN